MNALRRLAQQDIGAQNNQRSRRRVQNCPGRRYADPAEHHSVAAVLRPRTFMPSRIITPAPRKPIPERSALQYAGLSGEADIALRINTAAPVATRALVRKPTIRCRHCLFRADQRPNNIAASKCVI